MPQPSLTFQQLAGGGDWPEVIAATTGYGPSQSIRPHFKLRKCGNSALTQLAQPLFFLSAHAASQLCDWLHMSSCRGVIDNRFCFFAATFRSVLLLNGIRRVLPDKCYAMCSPGFIAVWAVSNTVRCVLAWKTLSTIIIWRYRCIRSLGVLQTLVRVPRPSSLIQAATSLLPAARRIFPAALLAGGDCAQQSPTQDPHSSSCIH